MNFEIRSRDAAGRIGKFSTDHGVVTTPNLMPVINPNRMLISPKEMKDLFGTEMIITNSYIIRKDEDLKSRALEQGLHRLIDFDGPIMTDSGTFQSYVYGDVDVDPLEIVEFQRDIGSDVGTILDIFSTPDMSFEQAKSAMDETLSRAKSSVSLKAEMNLAATVQGSVYPELRLECAKKLSSIGADFFPIGGVVPLMENQWYTDLIRSILYAKRGLDPSKPVHLFGAGHPLVFPIAVALGCDFFDSSAYAKYAADGRMMFAWGTLHLKDLVELPCSCPVCSKYSSDELKSFDSKKRTRLLAMHNLYVSFAELRRIRQAMREGMLWELVEERARSNPFLLEAMRELRLPEHKKWLERFEPVSTSRAVFYTGSQTIHRPSLFRFHSRLVARYRLDGKNVVVVPEANKPYLSSYRQLGNCVGDSGRVVVESMFGPVPLELDEMYPCAQSVFPKCVDQHTKRVAKKVFSQFIGDSDVMYWDDRKVKQCKSKLNWDARRVEAVVEMQFGKGAFEALFDGKPVGVVKSKKTGKIRNVLEGKTHLLSMRAGDGLFTLKLEGARRLHAFFSAPALRVVVGSDAVPFVVEGKSVFSKFVVQCDGALRPLDECVLVDEQDRFLGVGRCLLNREEMLAFEVGMAVKTRESIESDDL